MSGGRRAAPVTRGGASESDPRVAPFMQHLAARTLSVATTRSYRTVVERFLAWSDGEGIDWRQPERADLRRYVARLGDGAQRSTVQQRLAALGTFYRFWVRQGSVPKDPLHALARPQRERRLPDVLSAEQVSRLIDTAAAGEPAAYALRDTALIELLYGAGLRIAEVVSIEVRDLDLARGEVRVTGKGEKERVALFGAPCANKRGAVEEVKAHLQEAAKHETKMEDINNNSDYNAIPCGVENDSHAPYIMPPTSPVKIVLPEINKNAVSEVADYDYIDYATF